MEHRNITGLDALHPIALRQAGDPGALGSDKWWLDTSVTPPRLRLRKTDNTGWEGDVLTGLPTRVANQAARDARFPAPLDGQEAVRDDTGFREAYHEGVGWRPEGLTLAAGPVVSLVAMGAISGLLDAGTAAINRAALQAAKAKLVANGGGVLYTPKGRFFFGQLAIEQLRLQQNNITLMGDGCDVSVWLYNSSLANGTIGSGTLIFAGDNAIAMPGYSGLMIEYMGFEDTNVVRLNGTSYQPCAIDTEGYANVSIHHCRFKNTKGNSAININHVQVGGIGMAKNVRVEFCRFEGDSAGGWLEGDALNHHSCDGLYFLYNNVRGVTRHGVEGAPYQRNLWFIGNVIDHTDAAAEGLTNHGFGVQTVSNAHYIGNRIYGLRVDLCAFSFDSDLGGLFDVTDVDVVDNYVNAPAGRGIEVANTGGGKVVNVRAHHNTFDCILPIYLGYTPQGHSYFNDNLWPRTDVGGDVFIAGNNDVFHNATDLIECRRNIIRDPTGAGRRVIKYSDMTHFKTKQFRPVDNVLDFPFTSQNDGETQVPLTGITGLADGACSAVYTVTVSGARRGDELTIKDYHDFQPMPDKVFVYGRISADDTVKVWVLNKSGGALAADFTVFVKPRLTGSLS